MVDIFFADHTDQWLQRLKALTLLFGKEYRTAQCAMHSVTVPNTPHTTKAHSNSRMVQPISSGDTDVTLT